MEAFIYQNTKNPFFLLKSWSEKFPHLVVGFSAKSPQEKDWNQSNYAFHVGNQHEQVVENRKKLVKQLDLPFSSWTSGEQVHGTHIKWVGAEDKGRGRWDQTDAFPDTDGLLTMESNVLLTSFYADCVPLLFYDPDLDLIGVAHAGWKGTVRGMAKKMVDQIQERGADVKKLQVAIGPSIGSCCYQVDRHVINPLIEILPNAMDDSKLVMQAEAPDHYWLDLKEANRKILLQSGVLDKHITVSTWCTSCHQAYFHSYRRDLGNTGRMVAWIGKK